MRLLKIKGEKTGLIPGKILCLGKNFVSHAREMGGTAAAPPVVFLKPASALLFPGEKIVLPRFSKNVHFEVELVGVIGKPGKEIPEERASEYILGYAVGLDLTARDIQSEAKKMGDPWLVSKGFDGAAPISEILPVEKVSGDLRTAEITLWVNGQVRQKANLSEMIWPVFKTVAYLSTIFTLDRGDLIFMGTPEGVGAVHSGDRLRASVQGVASVEFEVF
jgi:fumarylpyruvate hydrolase